MLAAVIGAVAASNTSPMKRGLKGGCFWRRRKRKRSFKHFPDEEGTESKTMLEAVIGAVAASNTSPMKRGLKVGIQVGTSKNVRGFKHFPDEEGTESSDH